MTKEAHKLLEYKFMNIKILRMWKLIPSWSSRLHMALGLTSSVGLLLVAGEASVGRPGNVLHTHGMTGPSRYCVYTIQMCRS
jgi:hypothetical protein